MNRIQDMSSLFSKFTLFFCLCLSLLLALASFGHFKKSLILLSIFLSFLLFLISILRQIFKKQLQTKKIDLAVVILILLFSLFLSFFHHDLPRGRDDASYLVAAIKLSESKSLTFSDKLTHTFTGFRNLGNDDFTSQFLPGYSTYLAVFYNLGGLTLLFWANSLLIFLSLSFIYFLSKNLGNQRTGIISLLFLGTFYTTFWFPRRLVSENLFMTLFWFSVFLFFEGLIQKRKEKLLLGLIPMTLTLFVRGEAIGFWLIYLVIILVHILCDRKKCRKIAKTSFTSNTLNISNVGIYFSLILTTFNLIAFIYYLKIYNGFSYFVSQFYSPFKFFISLFALLSPFILTLLIVLILMFFWRKQILQKIFQFLKINFQKILFFLILTPIIVYEIILFLQKNLTWNFYQIQYGFKILTFYFIAFYCLFILFGLYHRLFKKTEFILTLLVFPSFLFLLRSQIALDLPWFLRHFYPVFIPFVFLMACLVLSRLLNQKFYNNCGRNYYRKIKFVILLFVIVNILFSLPIIAFSENKNVQKQLQSLAKEFKKKDLIIMTPGWNWQKWAYSFHYVYHLNILPNLNLYPKREFKNEIKKNKEKLDDDTIVLQLKKDYEKKSFEEFKKLIKNFDNIYLLIEKEDVIIYPYRQENLEFVKEFRLKYKSLTSDPGNTKYVQQNAQNLDIQRLNAKIEEIPPRTKQTNDLILKLYKVKNKEEMVFPERQYDEEDILDFRRTLKRWLR